MEVNSEKNINEFRVSMGILILASNVIIIKQDIIQEQYLMEKAGHEHNITQLNRK
jgi:hypothetical protein